MTLRINDIFRSIDGEVNNTGGQGVYAIFIRLQGCNLSCSWCDSAQAIPMAKGKKMTIGEIVSKVDFLSGDGQLIKRVTITGGEPLFQSVGVAELCKALIGCGYHINLETNGSLPIPFDLSMLGVTFVIDYKLPSSGMEDKMLSGTPHWSMLHRGNSYFKFVVQDRSDVLRAIAVKEMMEKTITTRFAISPIGRPGRGLLPHEILEMLEGMGVFDFQFNLQLHKLIIGVK